MTKRNQPSSRAGLGASHQPDPVRRRALGALALQASTGLVGLGASWPGLAQATGSLVYGFPAGGSADRMLGALVDALQGQYDPAPKRPVKYIAGKGAALAIRSVLRGPSDGSTILVAPSSTLTLAPQLEGSEFTDELAGLLPVSPLANFTFGLAVGPGVPTSVTNIRELTDWFSRHPDQATIGVPGVNTGAHVQLQSLLRSFKIPAKAASYQGTAPLNADLLSGAAAAGMLNVGDDKEGRLRYLLTSGKQRLPTFPDVPTLAELGYPELVFVESFGLFVHSKTPPEKVMQLASAARKALQDEKLASAIRSSGWSVPSGEWTPDTYRAVLVSETSAWSNRLVPSTDVR